MGEKLFFVVSFLSVFLFMVAFVTLLHSSNGGSKSWRRTLDGLGITTPEEDDDAMGQSLDRIDRDVKDLSDRVSVLERIVTDSELNTGGRL